MKGEGQVFLVPPACFRCILEVVLGLAVIHREG